MALKIITHKNLLTVEQWGKKLVGKVYVEEAPKDKTADQVYIFKIIF